MVEIKFLGYLTEIAGTRRKEVFIESPKPLREILPSSFPEKNIIILIDGKSGDLDTLIFPNQSVTIMPILSGG